MYEKKLREKKKRGVGWRQKKKRTRKRVSFSSCFETVFFFSVHETKESVISSRCQTHRTRRGSQTPRRRERRLPMSLVVVGILDDHAFFFQFRPFFFLVRFLLTVYLSVFSLKKTKSLKFFKRIRREKQKRVQKESNGGERLFFLSFFFC